MKTTLIATILGALVVGCWVLQVCTISATAVLETVILGEPHHDPHYDGALMNKMQSKTTSRICVSKPPGHDDQQCLLQPCTASDSLSDYGFLSYNNDTFGGTRMVLSGSANSGSGCAISHQYKFMYIHVLKSGGMTVKAFLKNALCGRTEKPCPMGDHVLEIVNCGINVAKHRDYFIWSFVRSPFSRLYSGYSMADSMRNHRAPYTFETFALATNQKRLFMSSTSPHHYSPQINFLFDSKNCPVVDFIGRLEHFDADMQIVLDKIQSPELQTYFDAKHGEAMLEYNTAFGKRKKEKELGGSLSKVYSTPELIQAVAKEFEQDFRLLGYDPTVVP